MIAIEIGPIVCTECRAFAGPCFHCHGTRIEPCARRCGGDATVRVGNDLLCRACAVTP